MYMCIAQRSSAEKCTQEEPTAVRPRHRQVRRTRAPVLARSRAAATSSPRARPPSTNPKDGIVNPPCDRRRIDDDRDRGGGPTDQNDIVRAKNSIYFIIIYVYLYRTIVYKGFKSITLGYENKIIIFDLRLLYRVSHFVMSYYVMAYRLERNGIKVSTLAIQIARQ